LLRFDDCIINILIVVTFFFYFILTNIGTNEAEAKKNKPFYHFAVLKYILYYFIS
jgi:hypothetical protein